MFRMLDDIRSKFTVITLIKGLLDENIPIGNYPLHFDSIFIIWDDIIFNYTDSARWKYFEDNYLNVCVITDKRIADYQRALSKYYTVFGEQAVAEFRDNTYEKYCRDLNSAEGIDLIIRQKHFNHIQGTMAIYYWEESFIEYEMITLGVIRFLNGLVKETKRIEEELDKVNEERSVKK